DYMLSIHRLVQAVQIDTMKPEVQRQWAKRVILVVNQMFPGDSHDIATWPQCHRYLDQAQTCHELIRHYRFAFIGAANILERTGLYLEGHAVYDRAESLLQHALVIKEKMLEPNHPSMVSVLLHLAKVYSDEGRHKQTEPLLKQALAIAEKALGP